MAERRVEGDGLEVSLGGPWADGLACRASSRAPPRDSLLFMTLRTQAGLQSESTRGEGAPSHRAHGCGAAGQAVLCWCGAGLPREGLPSSARGCCLLAKGDMCEHVQGGALHPNSYPGRSLVSTGHPPAPTPGGAQPPAHHLLALPSAHATPEQWKTSQHQVPQTPQSPENPKFF